MSSTIATSLNTNTTPTKHGSNSSPTSNQTQRLLQTKCAKFVPNTFNTNKCQQCFNIKDLHSIEALAEFSKVNYIFFCI
jgi:hypothetical protein